MTETTTFALPGQQRQRHADLLAALLPPVSYDPSAPNLSAELESDGATLDAVLISAGRILDQSPITPWLFGHPDLIPRWEALYQITPSPEATIEARQLAVLARINAVGGLSLAYFRSFVESHGYRAVVDEPREFRAGVGRAGDRLYAVGSVDYYWRVRARNADGTLLSALKKSELMAALLPLAPAGTHFDIED
jgi:uncharacterized protein YmfQ (DUF2313 family)